MTITAHSGPAQFNWWQRLLRRICGGQDYCVVVYCAPDHEPKTVWFTGVDMSTPTGVVDANQIIVSAKP